MKITEENIELVDLADQPQTIAWQDLMLIRRDIGIGTCFIMKDKSRVYSQEKAFPQFIARIKKIHPDVLELPGMYMVIPEHSISLFPDLGSCYLLHVKPELQDPRLKSLQESSRAKYDIALRMQIYDCIEDEKILDYIDLEDQLCNLVLNLDEESFYANITWIAEKMDRIAEFYYQTKNYHNLSELLKKFALINSDCAALVWTSGYGLVLTETEQSELEAYALKNPGVMFAHKISYNKDHKLAYIAISNPPSIHPYSYNTINNNDPRWISIIEFKSLIKRLIDNNDMSILDHFLYSYHTGLIFREYGKTDPEVSKLYKTIIGRIINLGTISHLRQIFVDSDFREKGLFSCFARQIKKRLNTFPLEKYRWELSSSIIDIIEKSTPDEELYDTMYDILTYYINAEKHSDQLFGICKSLLKYNVWWKSDKIANLILNLCKQVTSELINYDESLPLIMIEAETLDKKHLNKNAKKIFDQLFDIVIKRTNFIPKLTQMEYCITDPIKRKKLMEALAEKNNYKKMMELQRAWLKQL